MSCSWVRFLTPGPCSGCSLFWILTDNRKSKGKRSSRLSPSPSFLLLRCAQEQALDLGNRSHGVKGNHNGVCCQEPSLTTEKRSIVKLKGKGLS